MSSRRSCRRSRRGCCARGKASRVLLRAALARDAALIIVGSHGIGEGQRSLAGSTTEWLITNADRPILVVPDPDR